MPIFWGLVAYLCLLIYQDLQMGGDAWKQGDWLINNSHGTIRRGIVGSTILSLAEQLRMNPILIVTLLQAGLIAAVVALLASSMRHFQTPYTLWLLLLAPGFFVSFWSLDDQGGLRKELIVYLAFALLLFGMTHHRHRLPAILGSIAIFGIAVFAHEGNIFFAPFFAFCYLQIAHRDASTKPLVTGALAALGLFCAAAIMFALIYRNIDGYMEVCAPLLQAGVGKHICDGAIKALELPMEHYTETTFWILLSPRILHFILLYVLASLPVIFIGVHLFKRRFFLRAYLISALSFLPLYVIAIDWGRWVSWHITAVIFTSLIVLALSGTKHQHKKELSPLAFSVLLVFSLCWGFSHFVYPIWGGLFLKAITGIWPQLAA